MKTSPCVSYSGSLHLDGHKCASYRTDAGRMGEEQDPLAGATILHESSSYGLNTRRGEGSVGK